ncbi:hypothetical protein [Stenotrophomonas maltophilia]|uniref:hypothetical protein n=1 Tax=Stenotrophomonas maltophilia TaxID=40324 RepID=UPI00066B8380|nr:hypothetical protein [Stenotrophomonas maltophilia]
MSNDKKTMEDVRNLIVCDTQFGWTGSTTLRLQQMLALQERGWLAEGAENNEFDLTDAGRDVVARALQSAVQPTLADVQPGGRVRLGDGLRPCPFCGHSDFDQWPCEYIDASGANVVRCAHCHAAAPMKVWHALSAQPSPGGQDALHEAVEFARRVLAEIYATYQVKIGPFASQAQLANVKLGAALAARQPVTMDDALAAGDGTLHGAIDHWQERALRAEAELAARQPVGEPVGYACTNCDRTDEVVICQTCAGMAWDNGRLHEFHEVRELSTSLGEGVLDHLLPDEWHEKPLLRFQGAFDEGDRSVGIGERCGNVLAADQSGTVLGDYLASRAAKEGGQ